MRRMPRAEIAKQAAEFIVTAFEYAAVWAVYMQVISRMLHIM